MEDNSSKSPAFCINNCGYYGNPIYNHMCSVCYKKASAMSSKNAEKTVEGEVSAKTSATDQGSALTSTSTSEARVSVVPASSKANSIEEHQPATELASSSSAAVSLSPIVSAASASPTIALTTTAVVTTATNAVAQPEAPPARPVQTNKARCYLCRAKIPLAKQTINKCRCEYIYCDLHKVPEKHHCDYDFAKMGKDILAKNNPKLNDVHKGGRSFNRID